MFVIKSNLKRIAGNEVSYNQVLEDNDLITLEKLLKENKINATDALSDACVTESTTADTLKLLIKYGAEPTIGDINEGAFARAWAFLTDGCGGEDKVKYLATLFSPKELIEHFVEDCENIRYESGVENYRKVLKEIKRVFPQYYESVRKGLLKED